MAVTAGIGRPARRDPMGEFVRLEEAPDDAVRIIRLDRPKVNALSSQVGRELLEVASELEGRHDVRAVVVWGGPKVFAAGADITEFPTGEGHRDPSAMVDILNSALLKLESLPQITISAVNGYALGGGCELSMSTDFRVCGESAVFGQPEILLGIIPGAGGTQRLARLVGVTRAKDIVYTGRQVGAEEALAIGLVSAVHPDEHLIDAAVQQAATFARGPAALANAKRAIQGGITLPIADAIAVEKEQFVASFQTEDAVTGITSFLERGPGKASFTGR
jgi:enoyl-CoA hydratase/carnithine racemase